METFQYDSQPAETYEAALARVEALRAAESVGVNPVCQTQLLTHGRKTERAVVLLHGYTNCPHQYRMLAPRVHELGYNVLAPRLPYHGLADRMAEDHAKLTAEDLVACANQAVDIARGLGERVTVFGFSMSGVVAAWIAQHRTDVDRVLIVAPGFALRAIPDRLTPLVRRVARRLPNTFRWWDPVLKAHIPGPQHAYPRYSTRALAELLRLSAAVQAASRRFRPAARSIVVVTNACDPVLDNRIAGRVVQRWRRQGAARLQTYEFGPELDLSHDFLDPDQPRARPEQVYPTLIELIVGDEA